MPSLIGTNPNQVPTNADLGTMAFQDSDNARVTNLAVDGTATMSTVDINGGTIDGTAIGGTTPAAGAFTTLSSTGNTTLGDTATDTVTVNGYMGVGTSSAAIAARIRLTGSPAGPNQYGILGQPTYGSDATGVASSFGSFPSTTDAATTTATLAGFYAANTVKGATHTITNQHGLYIAELTNGTNNYGITSLVSSGTNKWNIYASGTAANYFAGKVGIGTIAPFGSTLAVSSPTNDTEVLRIGNLVGGGGAVQGINWIGLSPWDASSANVYSHARIGVIENSVASYRGSLVFSTRDSDSDVVPTERVRITSAGNVSIAVDSPDSINKLQVNGNGKFTGNLTLDGTARRIIADFDNDTISNRTIFQTSTANKGTYLGIMPNGTSTTSSLRIFASSDPNNANFLNMVAGQNGVGLISSRFGTGTTLPLTFGIGNTVVNHHMLTTSGNTILKTGVLISDDDGANKLQVGGSIKAEQYKLSALNTAPDSATATGTTGEIRVTSTHIYVCTATNTWVRASLSTW